MKIISTLTVLYFLLFIPYIGVSQDFVDTLSPVYLTSAKNLSQTASPIDVVNDQLIKTQVTIKQSLKNARKKPQDVIILSKTSLSIIDKASYLKALKKAANKSEDVTAFVNEISIQFPALNDALRSYSKIKDLYYSKRRQTFNGKLDTLPTSLQWI